MPSPGAGVRHRGPAGPRNPRRGGWADGTTKVLVGRLAGARCPALRSRRPFRLGDGVPARQIPSKARYLAPSRGGGRRAEPGLRTSRQKELAATAAKKPSPPGPPRHKRRFVKEVHFLFFENCKDFRLCKNAHPGLWGYEGPANLHCKKKTKVLRGPPGEGPRFAEKSHRRA